MFIKCKPIGKQRPRFTNVGRYVRTYTPKQTVELEDLIKREYLDNGGKMYDGLLKVKITAVFEPPTSFSNKKKQLLLDNKLYEKKPDIDNIAKLVLDALNESAYFDDKQVVELSARKEYGEISGINLEIEEIGKEV